MLLATDPRVQELALIDLSIAAQPCEGVAADLSHIEGRCKVSSLVLKHGEHRAIDKAGDLLRGCHLVIVVGGVPKKANQDAREFIKLNAEIAEGTVEAVAKYAPEAVVALNVNPINSVVPAMCELWRKAGLDPMKIVGVSTLDAARASRFLQDTTGKPARVPVIGGVSGTTVLPLFSQDPGGRTMPANDIQVLDTKVQGASLEVIELKKGKGNAQLSIAHAIARLVRSVLSGLSGAETAECAFVASTAQDGCSYFASKVTFGSSGVTRVHEIGGLSAHEQQRLEALLPELKSDIEQGLEFARDRQLGSRGGL